MRQEWVDRNLDPAIRIPCDIVLYAGGIGFYIVFHYIIKRIISELLIRALARVDNKNIDRRKFTRALWKVFCFGILSMCGAYCLFDQDWIFSPFGITLQWDNNATPSKINLYYMLAMVYYSGSFITMFFEEKQSDFYLMIYHHFVTLVLVCFSYRYNFLRYGAFIMFLHDVSDPWMDSAKIAVYLGYQKLGNILFIIFAGLFIIPRIFIYSTMILIPGYGFLWEFNSMYLVPIWILLLGVFLLNAYWSVLIIRMAFDFIKQGNVTKDIRDASNSKSKETSKNKKEIRGSQKETRKAQ
ncbi:very-long-chain ceramide synthase [Nematocida parisii]|uniref:TLC domain-containing protein n=1 Tax=Nematocida parisii (strain ERTm3) TaxID=935791 RepID=I3EIG2_NEMP3|nr:uncharacterized protein NEPG_01779 [Nematocida parisii ERTm1]EIJ89009.1 hypothetical protein NEQG_00828 [Nematocida parisii ERTm3]KAI5126515.1 very-long-chain ceramide synthase [Nematocida parisii]EIJ93437.1 hypothetical protein NEPG_01779 [Nematocida parisii ERTm1]KAI5128265.1 very-long-chain ceramide synthase [Nematocida parisii]KAI5140044.1 very-long-chain ceramide synthase [Nematocida parisii]|eukprot:XP_013059607.1 hypothetical protein NEPG_01779 [Nematocida parisii ERTm1]